jgi:hypothetical protein
MDEMEEAKERVVQAAKHWANGYHEQRSITEHQAYASDLVEAVKHLEIVEVLQRVKGNG